MPITIHELSLSPILQSINCTLQDNSLTLIVGRSGSGKSTFIQAIAGLVKPTSGSVTYDNAPLWKERKVNRDVLLQHAIAFQSPEQQLFAETVHKEFEYSLRPYRVSSDEVIGRSNVALEELHLPQSILQHSPFDLSGGQKRSVALATLRATDPSWMFMDEPSAGLDAKAAAHLREQLKVWKISKGILMATHDWEMFLPIADHVLLIRDGCLIADITPTELIANPGLLQEAGIGLPHSIKISCELHNHGIPMPIKLMSPEQMAVSIIHQWEGTISPNPTADAWAKTSLCQPMAPRLVAEHAIQKRGLYRIEARVKWVMYMILSVLILLQHQWLGVSAAIIVACLTLLLLDKAHAIQAIKLCKPLLLFIIITAIFAGIRLSWSNGFEIHFDATESMVTIRRMLPFLTVTLISFIFTLSTSTLEMQRGLEKSLSVFERYGIPTAMLALTASLVLRFIPMIVWEVERFSLIAAARGKRVVRRGQISLRDIRMFTIPLLISLFQMVEDLIVAIEIKGLVNKHKREVS